MRGLSKKMLISILTSVIVFVTMVATTFAWVGIFTYASTENFTLNLKVSELDVNYFLTISATGKKGSFSDSANLADIERQILKNKDKWNNSYIDSLDDSAIYSLYKKNSHVVPSTVDLIDGNLSEFKAIELVNQDRFRYISGKDQYLKFDLYLSVDTKEGIQETSFINSNVFLTEISNTIEGTISEYKFLNGNQFKNLPSADTLLKSLPDLSTFKINSKNAVRFALSLYNPKNINDDYNDEDSPIKTLIYRSGNQSPTLEGDVYDLGGNLPEDSNTALKELLVIRPRYKYNSVITYVEEYEHALENAIQRGQTDLELIEENEKLWNKPSIPSYEIDDDGNYTYNYLGVKDGLQTKQKISVYLWFEGWDADCLSGIDSKPVTLNLNFTAGIDD